MDQAHGIIRYLHIAVGFVVLITFWIPLFVKKGGKLHKLAGCIYVAGMAFALTSSAVLCVMRLQEGRTSLAILLGFLTLLSSFVLVQGFGFARVRKLTGSFQLIMSALLLLLFVCSVGILWYGILRGGVLHMIFGGIGLGASVASWKMLFKPAEFGKHYIDKHVNNMLISGGAAYTAFIAFGSRTIFGERMDNLGVLPWVLPTITVFLIIVYYHKVYKKRR